MRRPMHLPLIFLVLCLLPLAADAEQLKIATLAPDGSYWMTEARTAADEIADRTDGRVTFRFYPGGTMGDDNAVLRKMRIGQLHGGVFLAGSLSQAVPDLNIYNLPLLFESYDEVDAVRQQVDERLVGVLDQAGFHIFGFIEGGFAYIFTTKKASTFAELKGQKAWLPEDDLIGQVLIEEAGLSPVPLGLADVLTGLQTGLVDVVTGPPVAAVALQWFTKVKYVIKHPVVYTYGCMAVSNRAWTTMSSEDQAVVDEVLGRMTVALDRRAREDNQEALRALEKQGVLAVTPAAETELQWEGVARRSSQRLIEPLGLSRELLTEIEAMLAEHRATVASGGTGSQ